MSHNFEDWELGQSSTGWLFSLTWYWMRFLCGMHLGAGLVQGSFTHIPGVLAEMDGRLDSPRPSLSLMASVHRLSLRVVRLLNRPSGSCPSSYRPGLELAKRHSTTLHWSQLSEANRDSPRGARGTHLSLGGGVEEFVAAFHPPENVNGIILYIWFRISTLHL